MWLLRELVILYCIWCIDEVFELFEISEGVDYIWEVEWESFGI